MEQKIEGKLLKTRTKAEELRKIIEVLKREFPSTWQTILRTIVRVVV